MYLHFEVSDSSDGDLGLKARRCTMLRTFSGFLDSIFEWKENTCLDFCVMCWDEKKPVCDLASVSHFNATKILILANSIFLQQISIYASENNL